MTSTLNDLDRFSIFGNMSENQLYHLYLGPQRFGPLNAGLPTALLRQTKADACAQLPGQLGDKPRGLVGVTTGVSIAAAAAF